MEEVEEEVNAISACKLNTWNGGEAITTRRNLQVDMESTFEIFTYTNFLAAMSNNNNDNNKNHLG